MNNIDNFVGLPLLISAAIGLLLFLALMLIKLRNTAKPSFVFFFATGVIVAGTVYTFFNPQIIYLVFVLILTEFIIFLYALIYVFGIPKKREAKKAKKAQEQRNSVDANAISKELLNAEKERHKRILEINRDLITKVSTFFTSEQGMEQFLDYCCDLSIKKTNADGCVILLADEFDNLLAVKSFKGSFPPPYKLPDDLPHKPLRVETNLRFAQFPLTENIFGEIATQGEPVLIADSVKDHRVYQNGPEEFLKCGSYIFVPIKQPEGVAGIIALSRNPGKDKFTSNDLLSAEILTDAVATSMKPLFSFLSYAEHKRLTRGGDIATTLQKDMVPAKLPVIPGVGIGCFSTQAENICGDYYDVIVSRKDRISFIMADVAGKGMTSLIIMVMIRAILRLIVNTNQSAATILAWANRGLCNESVKVDRFASVSLINYNSETKEAEIATCGNNPVFLYTAGTKEFKQISIGSEPMGVEKDASYQDINLKLEKGDILLSCTDGLIESLDDYGVQYSADSIKKVIVSHANDDAKNISNRVKDDLKKFLGTNSQLDDASLIVLKVQ